MVWARGLRVSGLLRNSAFVHNLEVPADEHGKRVANQGIQEREKARALKLLGSRRILSYRFAGLRLN